MAKAYNEIWDNLRALAQVDGERPMSELFGLDPHRTEKMSVNAAGLTLDFSRNRVTDTVWNALIELAAASDVVKWRTALFSGEKINTSERRSVLHTALRYRGKDPIFVDGEDVMPEIRQVLAKMKGFCDEIRQGRRLGATGKKITDVVNIGIGGSDLGPAMVTKALNAYSDDTIRSHFVSNVDFSDLHQTLRSLDAASTLFIVCSKTFTTQETLANAQSARQWLVEQLGEASVESHFVAVSTNEHAVAEFGIDPNNMFIFWDWVGGRYSLWSSVGLSIALGLGFEHFEALLEGAFEMDEHFVNAPFEENLPIILALIGVWNRNFLKADSHCVLPYEQYLFRLPAYLQQLDMESNGKRVKRDGTPVHCSTGPIIWGEPGTNGQHAFYQLIHQGTTLIPSDIIFGLTPITPSNTHHKMLVANAIAQGQAFMQGKAPEKVYEDMLAKGIDEAEAQRLLSHRTYQGNIPSNTLYYKQLSPKVLGALIALYEHKVFVQGVIWDINSFDQFGVELGKELANDILSDFDRGTASDHDSSTQKLIEGYLGAR